MLTALVLLDAPILLTLKEQLRATTKAYIDDAGINRVMVVGGPNAISDQVIVHLTK